MSLSLLADAFPRGPGYYLNLFTLAGVVLTYLVWVRACAWVDHDARKLRLEAAQWNALVFGGGVIGLAAFWLVPLFLVAFPLMLLLICWPLLYYVQVRNERVPAARRVLTRRHLRSLARN